MSFWILCKNLDPDLSVAVAVAGIAYPMSPAAFFRRG